MNEKELIEKICQSNTEDGLNTRRVANMLRGMVPNSFHRAHNFIYELIQNADDAKRDTEFTDIKLEFILDHDEKRLIIRHNGKHFEEDDVRRICDVYGSVTTDDTAEEKAAHQKEKTHDKNKTGYKGIGFKAVFGISSKISIYSNKFKFGFKKEKWKQPEEVPWQIAPLWLDEGEVTEQNHTMIITDPESWVYFILDEVGNIEQTKDEMDRITEHPEILIFLRNIKEISFKMIREGQEKIEKISKKNQEIVEAAGCFVTVYGPKYQADGRTWLKYIANPTIDNNTKKDISLLDDKICPPKLKDAEKTEIIFSVLVQRDENKSTYHFNPFGQIESGIRHKFFCYLPTEVINELPFMVNANFILNQDRTTIVNNVWNQFLFNAIGTQQFLWLAKISKVLSLRNEVLSLFHGVKKLVHIEPDLDKSYRNGYENAIKKCEFLPICLDSSGKSLAAINEIFIDTKRKFFSDQIIYDALFKPLYPGKYILSYDVKYEEYINNAGLENSELTPKKIVDMYARYVSNWFRGQFNEDGKKEVSAKILLAIIEGGDDFCKEIRPLPVIHALQGRKRIINCPINCFFLPDDNQDLAPFLFDDDAVQPSFVNKEFYMDSILYEKLKLIGVNEFAAFNVISIHIRDLIKKIKVDGKRSILILRYIHEKCTKDKKLIDRLKEVENFFEDFSSFVIITGSGALKPIGSCFFDIKNKNIVPSLIISAKYFSSVPPDGVWHDLLKNCGLKADICLTKLEAKTWDKLEDFFNKNDNAATILTAFENFLVLHLKNQYNLQLENPHKDVKKHLPDYLQSRKEIISRKRKFNFTNFFYLEQLFSKIQLTTYDLYVILVALKKEFNDGINENNLMQVNHTFFAKLPEVFVVHYFKKYLKVKIIRNGQEIFKNPREVYYFSGIKDNREWRQYTEVINVIDMPSDITVSDKLMRLLGFKTYIETYDLLEVLRFHNGSMEKLKKQEYYKRLNEIYKRLATCPPLARDDIVSWKEKNDLCACDGVLKNAIDLKYCDSTDIDDTLRSNCLHVCSLDDQEISKLINFFYMEKLLSSTKIDTHGAFLSEHNAVLKEFFKTTLPVVLACYFYVSEEHDNAKLIETYKHAASHLERVRFLVYDFIMVGERKCLELMHEEGETFCIAGGESYLKTTIIQKLIKSVFVNLLKIDVSNEIFAKLVLYFSDECFKESPRTFAEYLKDKTNFDSKKHIKKMIEEIQKVKQLEKNPCTPKVDHLPLSFNHNPPPNVDENDLDNDLYSDNSDPVPDRDDIDGINDSRVPLNLMGRGTLPRTPLSQVMGGPPNNSSAKGKLPKLFTPDTQTKSPPSPNRSPTKLCSLQTNISKRSPERNLIFLNQEAREYPRHESDLTETLPDLLLDEDAATLSRYIEEAKSQAKSQAKKSKRFKSIGTDGEKLVYEKIVELIAKNNSGIVGKEIEDFTEPGIEFTIKDNKIKVVWFNKNVAQSYKAILLSTKPQDENKLPNKKAFFLYRHSGKFYMSIKHHIDAKGHRTYDNEIDLTNFLVSLSDDLKNEFNGLAWPEEKPQEFMFSDALMQYFGNYIEENFSPPRLHEPPVDIIIKFNDDIRYYIEVKSTEHKNNPVFYFSAQEFDCIRFHDDQNEVFNIFVRVYDIYSEAGATTQIFRDPFSMIKQGVIQFMNGGRFLLRFTDKKTETNFIIDSEHPYEDSKIGCKIS